MNGIPEQWPMTVTPASESQAENTDKLEGVSEPAGQLFQVTVDTVIELESHTMPRDTSALIQRV